MNTGWGIGRYITDLGTLGGQDAVYDPLADSLRALPVYSAYFGYERAWKPTFTSAFTYGLVRVSNLDIQPDDALRETQRTSLNLTWAPIQQLELVLEFLAGRRVNKDGAEGRLQPGAGRLDVPILSRASGVVLVCPQTEELVLRARGTGTRGRRDVRETWSDVSRIEILSAAL